MSYPKIIPPIETKAPSVRLRHVTHGTFDSSNELLLLLFSFGSVFKSVFKSVFRSVRGGDFLPVNGFFILVGIENQLELDLSLTCIRGKK